VIVELQTSISSVIKEDRPQRFSGWLHIEGLVYLSSKNKESNITINQLWLGKGKWWLATAYTK